MSWLTPDETAESVARYQILRNVWGQGKKRFPCLADYEQDWQPYRSTPNLLHVRTIHNTKFSLGVENEQADAGRHGGTCPARPNGVREKKIMFLVQLTTSSIGNLRAILDLK